MTRYLLLVLSLLLPVTLASPAAAQVVGKKKVVKLDIDLSEHKTKHYLIEYESVIPKSTVEKIGKELEDILEQYVRLFRAKPKEPLHVLFMDSQNTFEQVGGKPSVAGFYSRGPVEIEAGKKRRAARYLFIRQAPFYELVSTTYHEAFHQYLDMYVGFKAETPIWFDEGMASYFEEMQRDPGGGKNRKLNPKRIDKRKLRMVKSAVTTRTHIPLEKLIDARYEEFHDKSDKSTEALYYGQSFSVICFFMEKTEGRAIVAFMKTLKNKPKEPEAAHAKLFGKDRKNVKKVEAMWKDYLRRVKLPRK